ncbi:sugar phosphate isomerase/epimerase family protein [Halalkalicoccus jeotgali]|uniref:Xylose isomerase domain protein TIM barrel n=1 Tax=Halalkalicoccus jeotgali (strain DSM 18796 / CECT 7217 / JCM 14584 / KCTC 4019 / B3) TaxID=795797 RepID=D8JBM4_HALJB|nr:TIM barrel protein [Halalkalicoccus jeotgali]ADJ16677.1 Xylose isomerase domain protein TIM barrel [Halalkalicoccus jeotgali B3]ELY39060.1 Xylose isomerase domain-containing protein TIM barrel [Halalkalicoccus jeotgali B3]
MKFAGKCRPEPDALEELSELGFDAVELQLLHTHLDTFEQSIAAVQQSDLEVVSVHTPHASLEESTVFTQADAMAAELDVYLVIHSQYVQHVHIGQLEEYSFESNYGYENNPGSSRFHIENLILEQGHELVLDTAHLYMAEPAYLQQLERLLEQYHEQISIIHFADSTVRKDGLQIGAGTLNSERTIQLLEEYYEGTVVMEVHPPTAQASARELFQ